MGIINNIKKAVNFGSNQKQVSKASAGIVKNAFYAEISRQQAEPSPTALNIPLDLYQNDPVVQAAITTRADAMLANGYTIDGSKSAKKAAETKLDEMGFGYQFLEKIILNGLLYEHVFIEIVRNVAGTAKELHVLETTQMEIKHDIHGEITGFTQLAETGVKVDFPVDNISYIKFNSITSAVWGEVGIKSLYRTSTTKNFVEKFLNSLASTNAWRQVFKTKSMNADDIGSFMSYLRAAQDDPTMPLVMQVPTAEEGDNKFEILRDANDLKEFLGLLDYLRTQMLMELKVPPIMIGLPDGSNRSNSDTQMKAFHIANEGFRRKLTDNFNKALFEKLGITNITFSWNPIDKRSEKEDVEMAEKLINMGADTDMVEEFLRSTGLELPEGKLFKDPEPIQGVIGGPLKKSENLFPSRKRKDEGEANKKIGTGEDSTTREDQL